MTDLCHNCGDCHLGIDRRPCELQLVYCHLCKAHGHQPHFCPTGITRVQKDFTYLHLCHNCELWHLPEPCPQQLRHCPHCDSYGHTARFCPLAVALEAPAPVPQDAGNKRRRVDDEPRNNEDQAYARTTVPVPITDPSLIDPTLMLKIRQRFAVDTFNLVKEHGWQHAFYVQSGGLINLGQGPVGPAATPAQSKMNNNAQTNGSSGGNGDMTAGARPKEHQDDRRDSVLKGTGQAPALNSPQQQCGAPKPTAPPLIQNLWNGHTSGFPSGSRQIQAMSVNNGVAPTIEGSQQQITPATPQMSLAEQTALNLQQEQAKAMATPKSTSAPKPRRTTNGCAACKKNKKRCKHVEGAEAELPQGPRTVKAGRDEQPEGPKVVKAGADESPESLIVRLPIATDKLQVIADGTWQGVHFPSSTRTNYGTLSSAFGQTPYMSSYGSAPPHVSQPAPVNPANQDLVRQLMSAAAENEGGDEKGGR